VPGELTSESVPDVPSPSTNPVGAVAAAVLAATAGVVATAVWGRALLRDGAELFVSAPPFAGSWEWRWPLGMWAVVVLAVSIVVLWPEVVRAARWGALLVGSLAVSLAWTAALASSAGGGVADPLLTRFEYLPYARRVGSPSQLLSHWVERLPDAPTHVQGHPPGTVLAFLGLDRLGVGDTAAGWIVLVLGASAAPAALIAMGHLAGRDTARRAAVFVGLAPAVVWAGTSVDGAVMGVVAWATAAVAIAVTAEERAVAVGSGLASGLLVGSVATATYGAPALVVPWAVLLVWALWRRRPVPVVAAAAGVLVPLLLLAAAGFDWVGGFEATRAAYRAGVASVRPSGYFAVANLAVLAVAAGPATVAGIVGLRDRRVWMLVGGAVIGALLADLSGLSKGEVERIWLPLVPFLVVGTAGLRGDVPRRAWLGAQLAVAVVLQAWLRSPW